MNFIPALHEIIQPKITVNRVRPPQYSSSERRNSHSFVKKKEKRKQKKKRKKKKTEKSPESRWLLYIGIWKG